MPAALDALVIGLYVRAEFEHLMARAGATFMRPDRKTNPAATPASARSASGSSRRFGPAKANSASNTTAPRTLPGLGARIAIRLLALAAGIWHNHLTHQPARAFAAYSR